MGSSVRTLSGRPAVVTAIHPERREVTVLRLDDGEHVSFRWNLVFVSGGKP